MTASTSASALIVAELTVTSKVGDDDPNMIVVPSGHGFKKLPGYGGTNVNCTVRRALSRSPQLCSDPT